MAWMNHMRQPRQYLTVFLKWGFLGILMGTLGGLLGALFHHALHFVTHLRLQNTWLIFLLPLGGLLTVWIYRVFGLRNNRGTNEIIDAVLDGHAVSPLVAPVIFLATSITHLFGGSAGREGAALQLGGSTASLLSKLFKLKDEDRKILVMSGMSAVFAGLFGTPLTACLFTMEFESIGTLFTPALLPCYLSAYTASRVSALLGVHAEGLLLETATAVTLAAGFKGGEIVPTFCIGATFGCVLGDLLGLDAGFCGALGLVGLFCCATNSPVASIVLSIEMFGGANIHLFALVCVICFVLSGHSGLYSSQIIQFSKVTQLADKAQTDTAKR